MEILIIKRAYRLINHHVSSAIRKICSEHTSLKLAVALAVFLKNSLAPSRQ